ncbi:hypothetical protein AB205_0218270 [Aquarana catesbeiana]|uniref:Uncharacterized protein n=1 Tax=Aquarana catesbeiana TaxID=8400 RepID=A0A2G9NLJ7_AQUCT|nr:hypothetical protein AB205_0218270 [Aquarana catesbeiana]
MGDITSTVINMLNFVSSFYFLVLWFLKPCCVAQFFEKFIFSINMLKLKKKTKNNIAKKIKIIKTGSNKMQLSMCTQ